MYNLFESLQSKIDYFWFNLMIYFIILEMVFVII